MVLAPRPLARALRLSLAAAVAAVGSVAAVAVTAVPASAAPATCLDTLYFADNASGTVRAFNPDNGTVGATLYAARPGTGTSQINQLGIGRGGALAVSTVGAPVPADATLPNRIVRWRDSEAPTSVAKPTGPAPGTVAGAIDPASGLYYYGGYSGNSLTLFAYDPSGAGTSIGRVATVTVAAAPGINGDLAFSPDGALYFVSAGDSVTALYRLNVALPRTAGNPTLSDVTELSRTSDLPGPSNGIAFASDGRLYLGRGTEFTRVNPITGASEGGAVRFNAPAAVASTDLGSCAGPNTVTIEVRAPDGPQNPGDQFTGTLGGGSYDSPNAAPPPTSTFPAGPDGPASDPAVVLPGEDYTVGVTPAAGNGPNPYAGSYTCTDRVTGEVVAFGSGTSTDLSLPEGAGATIACVFDLEEPAPGIDLVKTVAPETFDSVGDGPLTYTFTVTNTGNTPLEDLQLTDDLAGLGPITCEPVAEGQTLPARERVPGTTDRLRPGRTVCTAERPITEEDVRSGQGIENSADVSAAPPAQYGPTRAGASDEVTADNVVAGPTATDDSVGAQLGRTVTIPAATNDTAGSVPIDLAGTRLLDADGDPVTELDVDGVGTFTVVTGGPGVGTIAFTPVAGYVGPASAPYRVVDENGFTADGTVAVTVRPGPSARADEDETVQGVDVLVPVLANDTPGQRPDGTAGAFDVDTLELVLTDGLPDGSTLTPDGTTLVVPGEGTWTVIRDGADAGSIRFAPEPGFTGPAAPVTYVVDDQAGNPVSSTISVDVDAVTPVAVDDTVKTPADTPVRFDPLGNDLRGDRTAPLDPTTVVLTSPDATAGGTRLEVPGEGTWTVGADGFVTFTPGPGHDGPTTPVAYEVADRNGTTATAELVVVVGTAPVADNDSASTPQATPVTVDVLAGDTPGDEGTPCTAPGVPADCDTGTFDPGSVVFPADGQPDGAVVSADGTELEVPGQGTWTVGPAGTVTFTPDPGYSGTADEVSYDVTDSYGNVATGTVTVVVRAITPSAGNDSAGTPYATPVTVDLLANDAPGADDNGTPGDPADDVTPPLRPALTVFTADDQPDGAVLSADGRTLSVPDEGEYVIGPDGSVVFTPADGLDGPASPVTYQVTDANGSTDTATLTVTVAVGPSAAADVASTPQATPVVVRPLGNDTAGVDPATGRPGAWDLDSLVFTDEDQPTGAVVSAGGTTLTVDGEGVYTIGAGGAVTFTPEAGFRDVASPVTYTVDDELGNPVTSTITITVRGIDPVAVDDDEATAFATPVTVDLLANDTPGTDGDVTPPLRPALTVFTATGQPLGAVVSADGRTLTLPGRGEYVIQPDGTAVFTPADGFSGDLPSVVYQVTDANGSTDTAELTIVVAAGPRAADDRDSTRQNRPVTLDPLVNDRPGVDPATGQPGAWDRGSVVFTADGQPAGSTVSTDQRTLTVPGEGVYTIDPDTGEVTFTPERGFTGETTGVQYRVVDGLGNGTNARIIIEVGSTVPTATDDRARTPYETPVTLDVLANDDPGADDVPLVPGSLRLVDGSGDEVRRLVVPGEGTWTVTAGGQLRFTPEDGFSGRTSPVTYTVLDANGSSATAEARVLVDGPGEALPTTVSTTPGTPVTVPVLDNVTPAPGEELRPGSVCVLPATITVDGKAADVGGNPDRCVDSFTLPDVGTWVVDPDGTITFTPAPGFTGEVTIDFQVTDTAGNVYTTTLTVDVTDAVLPPGTTPVSGGVSTGDDGLLPNTGGPTLLALLAGLLLLTGGGVVLKRSRRRA